MSRRDQECGSKRRHPTKAAAVEHVWALVRNGSRRAALKVYHCPHCGAWHVAHRRPK